MPLEAKNNKDIFEQQAKLRLEKRKRKRLKKYMKKRILIPFSIVLFFILIGLFTFLNALKYQSTDDAFIEGTFVSIAPKISGQVIKLYVDDNDYVEKGQLLLEIDSHGFLNKVHELQGELSEAKANKLAMSNEVIKSNADLSEVNKNLEFTKKDYLRYSELIKEGLCTKQQYEASQTAYKEALARKKSQNAILNSTKSKDKAKNANIAKIQAQLDQANLNLSYTKIYAPQNGYISSRSVEQGNYVNIAQPLMAIVSPKVWVIANFKETQLTNMKKGQKVIIKIDTYPNKKFKGHIDSIQLASGAKSSLFPPENAVGSYIKVVQRIPVKIVFDDDISEYLIAPGMSVIPKVKIK